MAKLIKVWDGSAWQTVGTASTVGAQGTIGTQGTAGTQGATGTQGSTGLQGTTGAQGTTGDQGTTGTQGTIGATGPASVINSSINSNITLVAGTRYLVDTTAARSLTLPASPTAGAEIQIFDAKNLAATNNITILRNSNLINGIADDAIIDVNGGVVYFVYTDATYGWRMF
jgi:hypothetical protein